MTVVLDNNIVALVTLLTVLTVVIVMIVVTVYKELSERTEVALTKQYVYIFHLNTEMKRRST